MDIDVVIVGGGPAGLTLAGELALAGVRTTLLERRRAPVTESRATTVHPRTMEVFDARGIADHFLVRAREVLGTDPAVPVWHYASMFRLRFDRLDTRFNYTLRLPQQHTESLLEQRARRLGARIRRGYTVTAVAQDGDGVEVIAEGPDGAECLRAGWVVGCDGAGSLVRTAMGIEFPGTDADRSTMLADVVIDRPLPSRMVSVHGPAGGVLATALDQRLTRFVITHHERTRADRSEPVTLAEIRHSLRDILGDDFGAHAPAWLSRFGNANRLAAHYRRGRALLAGDAAHMHYPAGGVGLNFGVQDAFNLGWKLAAQVNGWAPEGLLDSYHTERHLLGERLMADVAQQTAIQNSFDTPSRALRTFFDEHLLTMDEVNRYLSGHISGIDLAYPAADPQAHPLVGRRAPDLRLRTPDGTEIRLYELLHTGRYVLVGPSTQAVRPPWGDRVRHVPAVVIGRDDDWCEPDTLLIRPDAYLAWANTSRDDAAANEAVTRCASAGR